MATPSFLFPGYLNRDYNGFSSLMYYCTAIYCSSLIGPLWLIAMGLAMVGSELLTHLSVLVLTRRECDVLLEAMIFRAFLLISQYLQRTAKIEGQRVTSVTVSCITVTCSGRPGDVDTPLQASSSSLEEKSQLYK